MITVADIREQYTAGTPASSGDDIIIQKKINFAYGYIGSHSTVSMSASGENFEEQIKVIQNEFWLSLRMGDISIISLTGYDSDDVEYSLTDQDYVKKSARIFSLKDNPNSIDRVKVCYYSQFGLDAVNEIIKEIALYEFLRSPSKTGALNKTAAQSGEVSISFVKPVDFYQEIDREMDLLFFRGI